MSNDATFNINDILPVELLINILGNLTLSELLEARNVCRRWREVIDATNEKVWCAFCSRTEYYEVVEKNFPRLTWLQLCNSLHLWPKLKQADEKIMFGAIMESTMLGPIQILPDGNFGILVYGKNRAGVYYYNSETLQLVDRKPIIGTFRAYAENESVVATRSTFNKLQITYKLSQMTVSHEDVSHFLLVSSKVYYIKDDKDLYVSDMKNTSHSHIIELQDEVRGLTYAKGQLLLLLGKMQPWYVCSVAGVGSNWPFIFELCSCYVVNNLYEFNMLHYLDSEWAYYYNLPQELKNVYFVRAYGNIVVVGTQHSILNFFYVPTVPQFDFKDAVLLKSYDFLILRNFLPDVDEDNFCCKYMDIDVMEIQNGHRVILSLSDMMMWIEFMHNDYNIH